jgi:hypothetical protein
MPTVVRADPRHAARRACADATRLVVSVGGPQVANAPMAQVRVCVKDATSRARIEAAIARALRAEARRPAAPAVVVRVPSRKTLERVRPRLTETIAVVPVSARNLRHLEAIVTGLRASGVAGVQLAWDGVDPSREAAEAHVFSVLEHARSTPGLPPVVLARGEEPVEALAILVAHGRR